ncbi:MAG: hypothetical protein RLZZ241_456 [Bacteroidota bacterium]|jgi:uncharacterized protein YbbC (DUF1343 family)
MYNSKFTGIKLKAIKNKFFALLLGITFISTWKTALGAQIQIGQVPVVGANRTDLYFPSLKGKQIGLVANATSVIFRKDGKPVHLADSLLASGILLKRVFTPEHGFRGAADAGEELSDSMDTKTGLPLISLYGENRKPKPEYLSDLDLIVFDIQDLGVRFYTYIATLQRVMEACADAGIPILVLDRPNPNADMVDGPIMELQHTSFLGLTPIPLAYGLTLGEYATLINEEGWLNTSQKANLTVIEIANYNRNIPYEIPIAPSPNIPNTQAAMLYPSLGLFEGTQVNAGRGTSAQFQCFGAPFLYANYFDFEYVPESRPGAKNPKHLQETCYGRDLRHEVPPREVSLKYLLEAYRNNSTPDQFFLTSGFTKHAGTEQLQKQIETGLTESEIKATWQPGLEAFKKIREKYLRYNGS